MSEFVCKCGKELETDFAYQSHRKFCDETDIEPKENFECLCGETFKGKGALRSHQLWCEETDKESPEIIHEKVECPDCGTEVSENHLGRHRGSDACELGGTWETVVENSAWGDYNKDPDAINIKEDWKVGDDKYKCPECEKVYPEKGIGSHIWRKHTEEGKEFERKSISTGHLTDENGIPYCSGWNKGLTKEDHPSIKSAAQKLSEMYSDPENHPWYGESHTEEFKKRKSKQMSEFYEKNPEKHPNRVLAENRDEMTYPEKLASEKLDELGYEFVHNKKILKYYPDFLLVQHDVIIEVDGERWHSSKEQKEYDRKRDSEL